MTPQKNIHGFGIDTFRRPSTSFSSLRALHHERFISHGKLVFRSWSLFGLSLVSLWSLFGLSLVSPCLSLVSLRSARRSQLLEDHTPKDKEQARPRIRLRRAQEEKKRRRRRRRLVRRSGQKRKRHKKRSSCSLLLHQSTGGVFASCVFHSHFVRSFPSSLLLRHLFDASTDDAAGADEKRASGRARRRVFFRAAPTDSSRFRDGRRDFR